MEKVYLSTVTPVYCGADYLVSLVRALDETRKEFAASGLPVEIMEAIFVDDAAVDDSAGILDQLQQTHDWIRVVHLSRNFGQHAATAAGVLHSSGDWVVTLDEDLQHHPRYLLRLLMHAVARRQDVVYATSDRSVHASAFRNVSSSLTKAGASWLAGNPVIRRFSSFRMIRGSVARAAGSVSTHDTYFDVVLSWFTNRVDSMPLPLIDIRSVSGHPGGYSLTRLLLHARRMFISSEIRPLRLAAAIGMSAVLASLLLATYILLLKAFDPAAIELRGWASLILTISFFGGLTSLLIGIALEYMSTLVLHMLGKPTFFAIDRSKDLLLLPFTEGQNR